MNRVLVCGGAGYIGSHIVDHLVSKDYEVTVIDNLSVGHRAAVHPDAVFVHLDLRNWFLLRDFFHTNQFDAVIHMASHTSVPESIRYPFLYLQSDVDMSQGLIRISSESGVRKFIYSSTCNIYGTSIDRYHRQHFSEFNAPNPSSPYGESKLMVENTLRWVAQLSEMEYVSLRYFNAAGASLDANIGEDHRPEHHLIPLAVRAALGGEPLMVYGSDYPTHDGTAYRDYVHVLDLADAHEKALHKGTGVYNLGSGHAWSVQQIANLVSQRTGKVFPIHYTQRREGDPAYLSANIDKAKAELGWTPKFSIDDIITTAVNWHRTNPEGYRGREVEST